MFELALLKMAHLLCLVYWLGADLGVFYSSFFVADENRSPEVRVAAAKILFTLDFAPRISMPLMLATGVHLASLMGVLKVPDMVVSATWILCLGWLAMVLAIHFLSGKPAQQRLITIDFAFRVVVIAVLLAFPLYVLAYEPGMLRDWAAYKLIVFALMVFCGLMIRIKLRRFTPAFKNLVLGKHDTGDSQAVSRSLSSTRPYVIAIWIGLLLNTAWSVRLI